MSSDRATIYQVAAAAGVSPATVSRTFSQPGRVSSATAQRVFEVAKQLGYRSGEVFRPAIAQETKVIAMLVSDIANPFFFPIVRGAKQVADKSNYKIVVGEVRENVDDVADTLAQISKTVDGVILVAAALSDNQLRRSARQLPTVVVNRRVKGMACILADDEGGMYLAVKHLAELGHRRICYIRSKTDAWTDGVRWSAFKKACLSLDVQSSRIGPVNPDLAGGVAAGRSFVPGKATALVAFNDLMAVGCIRAFQQRGLQVPQHVSVIGFDNTMVSALAVPGLTTVSSPLGELGQSALSVILEMLSRKNPEANDDLLTERLGQARLVIRESTNVPGKRSARG